MNEIIMKLKDKDDKAAYEYSKIIGAESAESDKYLPMLPEFADMIDDKIEVSKYKDSMSPLIEQDINELMKVLG